LLVKKNMAVYPRSKTDPFSNVLPDTLVKAIDEDARQLAQALVDGTKIVITTVQKFPFISQIIPYSDQQLEMLYSYGRLLTTHLSLDDDNVNPHPEKEVDLQYYRIERVSFRCDCDGRWQHVWREEPDGGSNE